MNNWIDVLAAWNRDGRLFAMLTITGVKGSAPRETGARMLVCANETSGTIGGGEMEHKAVAAAHERLNDGGSQELSFTLGFEEDQICGGAVEVLLEVFNSGPRLLIYGAGHVGRALCAVLDGTSFRTTVIDARPEQLDNPDLPASAHRVNAEGPEWNVSFDWSTGPLFVAVMTHSHELDLRLMKDLLGRDLHWLGMIGSRSKWGRFRKELQESGVSIAQLEAVHCPIGRSKCGKSPREIAISISAELLEDAFELQAGK